MPARNFKSRHAHSRSLSSPIHLISKDVKEWEEERESGLSLSRFIFCFLEKEGMNIRGKLEIFPIFDPGQLFSGCTGIKTMRCRAFFDIVRVRRHVCELA
ncbi:hypothetical protein CEXT_13121 [Caerostris extrusa]|uniref:Uncharacterized protein n=1 Tax=Caerostris extrusa TaxID=172846 RepID=A0AAV4VAR5_CAEEX|nr:hypothetical protein CEXT_13121 [Caerostris extrusa]